MKKIVITQLVDNSISIYGVFNTFKDAYVQFNRFNENILKTSKVYLNTNLGIMGFNK